MKSSLRRPSSVHGLDYRVDATVSRTDGFRDLASKDYEIKPVPELAPWRPHPKNFALDIRHLIETPDSFSLITRRPTQSL